jgi:hypothetical protein
MPTNVSPFRPTQPPEPPMLEQRVERLEADMKDVKSSLKFIEGKLSSIDVTLARLDERTNAMSKTALGPLSLFTAVISTWAAGAAIVFTLLHFVR